MIDFIRLNSFGIKSILYFDTLDSTNDYAKKELPGDDTLIVAGYQSSGKGRLNRKWDAEKNKNLTFTLVKSFDINEVHLVNFYTSYILFKTLKDISAEKDIASLSKPELKWPNDILLDGKKVSGILTELVDFNKKPRKFIIGVGVNVNQDNFPAEISGKATSLKLAYGRDFDMSEIITVFVRNFYESTDLLFNGRVLMEVWRLNTGVIGKKIRFRQNDTGSEAVGTVLGISDDGGIRIEITEKENEKKLSVFYSGEISFIY